MSNLYDLFFNALKDIEKQNDPKRRGGFSFSAHGKSAASNLKFRLQCGNNPAGVIEWRPVVGLGAGGGEVNHIHDVDIENVKLQCEKVEVNPYWTERVVMLFKAMQSFGVVQPTFQVNGYHPSGRRESGYALRVRGWLHDEANTPVGEILLEVHVFRMGQYEKASIALENAGYAPVPQGSYVVTDHHGARGVATKPLDRAQIREAARAAAPLNIADKRDVVVLGSGHDSLTSRARAMGGVGHIPNA